MANEFIPDAVLEEIKKGLESTEEEYREKLEWVRNYEARAKWYEEHKF